MPLEERGRKKKQNYITFQYLEESIKFKLNFIGSDKLLLLKGESSGCLKAEKKPSRRKFWKNYTDEAEGIQNFPIVLYSSTWVKERVPSMRGLSFSKDIKFGGRRC